MCIKRGKTPLTQLFGFIKYPLTIVFFSHNVLNPCFQGPPRFATGRARGRTRRACPPGTPASRGPDPLARSPPAGYTRA